MNEFLNIYRLYAKNFDRDFVERAWDAEDIEKLKKLLDKICGKIENGHIIIGILKNDLDIWQDLEMKHALQNIRDTIFEIESLLHSKDQGKKPDRLIKEDVEERKKKEKELEPERDEIGKWKKILKEEKPLKQYGTINIYSTIKDYIWDRLPTDFKYADVIAFFKEFHEEKLGRRLKGSSYGTYASRYIKYFKEHDPPMISWDVYGYSKDIDKYKTVDKEPEKKEKELEPERDEIGKWKKILKEEKPLKQYGTIGISPTIKDYIWDRLPTAFKYVDVVSFFKEFYEEKLGRMLKESSYGQYASRYLKYFKEHDPPMISWDEYGYSKDIDKYKTVDKEPEEKEGKIAIPPKPGSIYMPWEIQILKKHWPLHTAEYIHENLLPHRTAKAITLKAGKLGIKKVGEYKEKGKIKSETELWRTDEDDVIREYHPYMTVEEYIGQLPGRSIDEVTARASYLKVKEVTDTNIARDEMLESGKQNRDVGLKADETIETKLTKDKVGDGRRLTDETKRLLKEEHEKAKQQKKEEETKKLLSEERIDEKEGGTIEPDLVKEHIGEKAEEIIKDELAKDDGLFDEKIEETIEKLEKEDKRIEREPIKTKLNNPFYKGSVEHHLYQIAVESNWTAGFKKGTPKVMIMTRMANFSKEEIKNAIDMLVKKRKAQRLPNNFIAFSE